MDKKRLIDEMTNEEKATLLAGRGFTTAETPRLGIKSITTSDGPHGVRHVPSDNMLDFGQSVRATAFPTASAVANSFNPECARRIGKAIGEECRHYNVDVILGPGVNIKRSPLCGRNFEYYSEDPYLAGKMGAEFIKGVQSTGVSACIKHFALNNTESFRFSSDSLCDERAIRDIYIKPFEIAITEGKPDAVMCAYNKVGGTYCSENRRLLHDVLRGELGFLGIVMSDWGATHDRVMGIKSGLDLEMPGNAIASSLAIVKALEDGTLTDSEVALPLERILSLIEKHGEKECSYSTPASHEQLARAVATECAVLLKNNGILPLRCKECFAIYGEFFDDMRYQGAGSSLINATRVTTPRAEFDKNAVDYRLSGDGDRCETALVFIGLCDRSECEGRDRTDMKISDAHMRCVAEALSKHERVVVVLFGGSPMELPFADSVDAILYMGLDGQECGGAVYELLFGGASPSGRLAESWPYHYTDTAIHKEFSKTRNEVYRESIYVGYRYYTTAAVPVRYPFGYGLSYSRFDYSQMSVRPSGDGAEVTVTVKNIGEVAAAEVVQLYVSCASEETFRPRRELCSFTKIYLEPNEETQICLYVDGRELSYYNTVLGRRVRTGGNYLFSFCADSETELISASLTLSAEDTPSPYSERVLDIYSRAAIDEVSDEVFSEISGLDIPPLPSELPITLDSRFSDLRKTFFGRILYFFITMIPKKKLKKARKIKDELERRNATKAAEFLLTSFDYNTLRSMSYASGGMMPLNLAEALMHIANGHVFRGLGAILRKNKEKQRKM